MVLEGTQADQRVDEIEQMLGIKFNLICTSEEQVINAFEGVRGHYSDLGDGAILDTGVMSSIIAQLNGNTGITYRGPHPKFFDFEYFDVRVAMNRFRCYVGDWHREGIIFHEMIHADHLLKKNLTLNEYRRKVESDEIDDDHDIIPAFETQYFKADRDGGEYPDIKTLPWREE